MVVVAVVGGTGNVGKTIVDAFKEDGKHEVIVLTRKAPEGGSAVPVVLVDYNNVEELNKTLESNKINTLISTISMYDPKSAESERNLVAAAAKSAPTKRFVASCWGNATPEDESLRMPFNAFRDQTIEALRKTDLEWTQFHNGFFLDYFGQPHVKTYLTPLFWVLDIGNAIAAIPGATGDEVISFTYTKDLAKFVVAAISLPKWDEALHCYSENTTLNHVIQTAEEATGKKFNITYDPAEKLQRGEITELPSHPFMYKYMPKPMFQGLLSRFGLWAVNGLMYVPKEGSLNEKFPEIATTNVKEIVGVWEGK